MADHQLVSACQSGDETAWETLIARYERLVYTIPFRYGLTPAESEDVFQSVWLILLKNLPTIQEPDRISAWLVTTTRRQCWDLRRGAEHERTTSVQPDSLILTRWSEGSTPEEILAHYEETMALREKLDQLPERCRQLLNYLYRDPSNPNYEEIATRLDMPVGSIGPTKKRCLEKLLLLVVRD